MIILQANENNLNEETENDIYEGKSIQILTV